MEKLSELCVLLAALSQVVAGVTVTPAYFLNGGELKLNVMPAYSERISNILWTFRGDLLAVWDQTHVHLGMFGTFIGRTDLDMENGGLVIRRMSEADMGPYTVEINGKVHGESYNAQMIKDLGIDVKIEVALRTLTCNTESETCDVSCDANIKQAGPVTYSWKIGHRDWKVLNKDVTITKAENANDEIITCRISNPLSGGDSEPFNNPLYSKSVDLTAVWVLLVILLVGLCVGVGVLYMWKRKIYFFKNPIDNDEPMTATPGNPSPKTHQEDGLLEKTHQEDGLLEKTHQEDGLLKKTPDGNNGEGVAAVSCP